ncbi:MAG TPA: hypothetical protein VEI25_00220 [Paraburkholderia sp.]|nr:hypothetical protein [Paraburkholderia sp.]
MSKLIESFLEDEETRFRVITVYIGFLVITGIPLFTAMFIYRAFFR